MIEMILSPSDLSIGERALSLEEHEALVDYNLWVSSNYDDEAEDVEKALDLLLSLFPQRQAIILRRAQIYFEQDKCELARTDITFVLTQDPTHVDALILGVTIAHKAQQDEALLADVHRLLNLQSFLSDPDMFDDQIRVRSWRSKVYIKQNLFDLALPDLAHIIEQVEPVQEQYRLFHYYYDALNARSEIFKTQGRFEEELLDLNQLLTPPSFRSQKHLYREPYGNVHSYSQRGLYRRSEIYVAQENYGDALRDLDALLNGDEYDAPALMLRRQVDELVIRKKMLFKLEGSENNRAVPSLKTLAKMTFFRHEVNIDTSECVASNPTAVRTLLNDIGITPEVLASMRALVYAEVPVKQTVFEEIETHGLAAEDWDVGASHADNNKRKCDAISPSVS
jgi:tetratricopeptide (TPR) repeat protein